MFEGNFNKPKPIRQSNDNCKITIKNTKQGRSISFSGRCSKEQLEMAKMANGTDSIEEEE